MSRLADFIVHEVDLPSLIKIAEQLYTGKKQGTKKLNWVLNVVHQIYLNRNAIEEGWDELKQSLERVVANLVSLGNIFKSIKHRENG